MTNLSLRPPPHATLQLLIRHQQTAALLDSVVFFNARVKMPVRPLWPPHAFYSPHTNTSPTTTQPTGTHHNSNAPASGAAAVILFSPH